MKSKTIYLLIALLGISCTRDEEVLPNATFPTTAGIFTDVPVSLTDEFFISFDPAQGANTNGFGVDEDVAFEGTTSIRIDVPSDDDPDGTFIGGIFLDRGEGRDLTSYNALTFWARASTTATIGLLGFGTDFGDNTYAASLTDTDFSTKWTKYVIPIPDPSKLVQEKGMFIFSAGSQSTGGQGYTFWIDELKFENLTSVAQRQPRALDLQVLFNVDGQEVAVNAAAGYFDESDFDFAPTPPARDAADVVSIFSDSYTNVQVDNYNGFFQFATTQGGATAIGSQNFISYTDLNFVSINMFNSPDVNATGMTHIHVDINVREAIDAGDFINFQIINNDGGASPSSGTVSLQSYASFQQEEWVSYDIPLTDFTGLAGTQDIDLIFFVSDATISNVLVDNVYFYR
ncbi:MAG: carbohydrate-binding protein [Bacteroidota bacterium]